MSFELIIRPEAEADVLDAFRWYNDQVPGLGQEFLIELDDAFESIRANPEASRRAGSSTLGETSLECPLSMAAQLDR